eukprot:12950_1
MARRRANTMPSVSSNTKSVANKTVIKPKIKPTAPKPESQAKTTIKAEPESKKKTPPPSKPESVTKSTKRLSKVAALSASLSSKGISYGQTRPLTKPKPFKSTAECNTNIINTFEKPSRKKRRPKTKKTIDLDIDSDDNKDTSTATPQIIQELKLQITALKATQKQNENELKLKNEQIKTLKETMDSQAQTHDAEVCRMEAEIASLHNAIAQLKDDDIVIVETDGRVTLDIKSNDATQTDSNYKVSTTEHKEEEDEPMVSKGLFDDVKREPEHGLFEETDDTIEQETKKIEHAIESKSVKVTSDPLMADTNALFEDILDHEEESKKKPKTVATARVRDIFDEEDEQNDLFGFIGTGNRSTEDVGDKKKRIASLFDSDDDDDDLFGFDKDKNDEDTMNID